MDGISIWLIILTALLIPCCFLISFQFINFLLKEFFLCLFFLEESLISVFTVLDFVCFYPLFEGILIPMFLIIGLRFRGGESAGFLLFLYLYFSVFSFDVVRYIYAL